MPHPVAAGHQRVAGHELRDGVDGHGWVALGAQAPHQDVGVRMGIGLGLGDLAAVHQRLDVGVVAGAVDELGAPEVVDARVARMRPVAVAAGMDEEGRHGAVGLLLRGNGRQADHDVRLFRHVPEHGDRVVAVRRIALEELARGHHDLVGRLAPPAAAAHAVGHHAEHAAVVPGMRDQRHLVLLVVAVAFVDTGRRSETKRFGHGGIGRDGKKPAVGRERAGAGRMRPGALLSRDGPCFL